MKELIHREYFWITLAYTVCATGCLGLLIYFAAPLWYLLISSILLYGLSGLLSFGVYLDLK